MPVGRCKRRAQREIVAGHRGVACTSSRGIILRQDYPEAAHDPKVSVLKGAIEPLVATPSWIAVLCDDVMLLPSAGACGANEVCDAAIFRDAGPDQCKVNCSIRKGGEGCRAHRRRRSY